MECLSSHYFSLIEFHNNNKIIADARLSELKLRPLEMILADVLFEENKKGLVFDVIKANFLI